RVSPTSAPRRRSGRCGGRCRSGERRGDAVHAVEGKIEEVIRGEASWCVVHGDALHVLRDLPDGCVDAFVTDPPYSSGGAFRGDRVKDTTADVAGSDYAARAAGQRALFGEG